MKKDNVIHLVCILLTIFLTLISKVSILIKVQTTVIQLIFFLGFLYGLKLIRFKKRGYFLYTLNWFLFFGFGTKLAYYLLTGDGLIEPTGHYNYDTDTLGEVLNLVIFFLTIYVAFIFLNFKIIRYKPEEFNKLGIIKPKSFYIVSLLITLFVIFLGAINHYYGIIFYGLLPKLNLPAGGNGAFFLFYTRVLLLLFFAYCYDNRLLRSILLGGVISTFIGVGVLSRIIIVFYFIVVYFDFFILNERINLKKAMFLFLSSCLLMIINVKTTNSLRAHYYEADSLQVIESEKKQEESFVQSPAWTPSVDIDWIIGRWVGIEGLMAVTSYPDLNPKIFFKALTESGYKGSSFYSRFTDINNPHELGGTRIYTSVPGPFAFFYYSGNLIIAGISFLLCLIFLVCAELVFIKFVGSNILSVSFFILVALDFSQFGVAPLGFIKNLFFVGGIMVLIVKIVNLFLRRSGD